MRFLMVLVGGVLISAGGIYLAFLFGDKQLLFFSLDFVLMILAPLLFVTILLYSWGLLRDERANYPGKIVLFRIKLRNEYPLDG